MAKQTARELALHILLRIEEKEAYSNLLLNRAVETNPFSPQDKALLTRIVYGTVQHKNTLDYDLSPFLKKEPEGWVRVLLRMSLYQMVYLDRVPDRAVLHESVEIAKKRGHKGIAGLVNGVLRSVQRKGLPDPENLKDPMERLAVETSHPTWLLEQWLGEYDKDTVKKICDANNKLPVVTVRTNTTKISRDELLQLLKDDGIEAVPGFLAPEAIRIQKGVVQQTRSFQEGLCTIQDESSMLVAHALDVEPDMKVLDSCAAPGGKTTHIAQLLNNTGQVTALDLHQHKVNLIKKLAERLGLTNVTADALDSRKAQEKFREASFDRILVDAPCSGLGVIRRKPDIKWSKSLDDVHRLAEVQAELLRSVASLLKPGGKLVYSTCTLEKEENEAIVDAFLHSHPEFSRDRTLEYRLPEAMLAYGKLPKGMVRILPFQFESDGFFISVFERGSE